ncbi:RNA-directed DNA polymerase reverse transcriptase family protein [Gossypium australe]|uniref:RNA-directed DNA polymerase reverse transcriptase family protein n=1 Tax=Gossypium australe TaxID=47621 RepID=A0A5B6X4C3_9ROSI|nr:RNA-directed DNA polymerase reverse transcriptase family protein [Gossypium australe]
MGRSKKMSFQNLKDWFKKKIYRGNPMCFMTCFLLPKSLCGELESIMARFGGKNDMVGGGIHWCEWNLLCELKESDGYGFRSLTKFDLALLAKQGCHLITYTTSLLSRVLKAKYYPHYDFLIARLGDLPSYT